MEFGKRFTSITEEKIITKQKTVKAKGGASSRNSTPEEKRIRECRSRATMIPVLKNDKNETKISNQKAKKCPSKLSSNNPKLCQEKEELERKLKSLEEKEKSIAEYYRKIEEMMRQFSDTAQKEKMKPSKLKTPQNFKARKITSDPLVFNKTKVRNDILADFESNVQQISEIWLKTSNDLSNTLKNLKNNPSLDPLEFEVENVRIQTAIKQARSLTLLKTRNIIAEAKKLFHNREVIRSELEGILSSENLIQKCRKCICQKEESEKNDTNVDTEPERKEKSNNTSLNDSFKGSDFGSQEFSTEESLEEKKKKFILEDSSSGEKENSADYTLKVQNQPIKSTQHSVESMTDLDPWAKELARKNETIAILNNEIFDLQKQCNEHSIKYNKLKIELSQFHEKIQWNQVLWKQIGKLKLQIKGLQQSNQQLEAQKKEKEMKILKLDQELDRVIKLNRIFNQKEHLLAAQKDRNYKAGDCDCKGDVHVQKMPEKDSEGKFGFNEKVLSEKQIAINQLKNILSVMRDQENFAQKQISMFQSKIEELEKNALTKS